MTESEFMSRARIGLPVVAFDATEVFPALIEFLRSNGFHDVARVVLDLEDRYEGRIEDARLARVNR